MPFAFMQYTLKHGPGLVTRSDVGHSGLALGQSLWFSGLEAVMVVFVLLHFILTAVFLVKLWHWLKTDDFKQTLDSPLRNAGLLAPFISVIMTMNVFIGPVRYFIPALAANLQLFMAPALGFWALLWLALIYTEIRLLKISFDRGFDVNQISFGWLLHPFALGMLTVVGTGIAAMSQNASLATTAAFLSLVSGTMGLFLLVVKLIMIFKSHFAADGLPERQFLPSFLIVVPNITLYAISAFRFGHYLEHTQGMELGSYYLLVITAAFAFEVWYMLFGMALLSDYFKKHFWQKEFYVTQWGFVCPVVAFGVLGSFTYKVFAASAAIYGTVSVSIILAVALFGVLLARHLKCAAQAKAPDQAAATISCLS